MKQLDITIDCVPYDICNEEEYIMEMNHKLSEMEGMFEIYSLMRMGNIHEYILKVLNEGNI